jgi:hypothetical protein
MLKSDRVAQALATTKRNGCFEHDYERLPEAIRAAIELLIHTSVDHPFFATARIASLLSMTAENYRQSLHTTPRPQLTHR